MAQENQWHVISWKEAAGKLNSDPENGLAEKEIKARQEKYGENSLPKEKPLPKVELVLKQLKNPLIYILLIAGVITAVIRNYTDTFVISATVLINIIIGFFQENKTSQILAALKKAVKVDAYVLRSGNEKKINQEELVPGDIMLLNPGDRVPADGRLIEAHNLRINEASLTGEWISSKKETKPLPEKIPIGDRDNMVYMGTVIEEGTGKAIITETGVKTEIGQVVEIVARTKEGKTPYQKKVTRFSRILGAIILLLCLLIFGIGLKTGKSYFEMLFTAVAMAIAAVPEGLPTAVTIIFALGVQEILKRKGLVRQLVAAETLGSASVICSDKTGTLTEAKMQVAGIFTGEKDFFSAEKGDFKEAGKNGSASRMLALEIAVLCSSAFIENPDDALEKWIIRGRPTEKALLMAGVQAGLSKKALKKKYQELYEIPFDSSYKFSAALFKTGVRKNIFYILGAPEIILRKSKYISVGGKEKALSEDKLGCINKKINELAAMGQRILATAYCKTKEPDIENPRSMAEDLVFVGLIALHDPLRKDAKSSIKLCQQAGMRVIIVTGDHKLTAKAIAKELGLPAEEENILEGGDLDKISDEVLKKQVKNIEIYARVEPRHKMRIIEAWQDNGAVVAMTGDGINDAPALKKANIGISLSSGTEVAKEASDLVLLNDSFSTIIVAVQEGRRIMDNVRKVVTYLLTGGFTEIMLIGLSVVFSLPLPVLPAQILWKNLVESTPPSLALVLEPKEKEIMRQKPEDPKKPLLTSEMNALIFIIGFSTNLILFGIFLWFLWKDLPLDLIRTAMFVGLAIDSFFLIFSCRNLRKNIWSYNPFSNKHLTFTILGGFLMLLAAVYLPLLQKILKTAPLGLFEWTVLFGFGFLNLFLIEITKLFFIKKKIF